MSESSDERFHELANKVADGINTHAEREELDTILRVERTRVAEFEQIVENTGMVKKAFSLAFKRPVEVPAMSEKYRALFLQRMEELYGPESSAAQTLPSKELSENDMQLLLLKVLSEMPMDGFELIKRLEKTHVELKGKPQAAIYRVLEDLEMSGHLGSEWVDRPSRRVKVYRLTKDLGRSFLQEAPESKEVTSLVTAVLGAG